MEAAVTQDDVTVCGTADQDFLWVEVVDIRARPDFVTEVGVVKAGEIKRRVLGRLGGTNQDRRINQLV